MNSAVERILSLVQAQRLTPEEAELLLAPPVGREGATTLDADSVANTPGFSALLLRGPASVADLTHAPIQPKLPAPGDVLVAVKAASLNFADLLCVRGLYPTMPEYPFAPGLEVAGTVCAVGAGVVDISVGDDVIALSDDEMGGHATALWVSRELVVRKPANVSFEEACAFPIAYITAKYIFDQARVGAGERVLIQTAAGGVGLIAVQLAMQHGAEIFATAGSAEKLEFLQRIGVQHVINYRQDDFYRRIQQLTAGYGVDVVLNTLSGDAIQKGLDLLAPGGRYFEIAMTGLRSAKGVSLANLVNNQTFHSVDLRRLFAKKDQQTRAVLSDMREALAGGKVRPWVDQAFPWEDARAAYECLERARNIGKVVLSIPDTAFRHVVRWADSARAPVDAARQESVNGATVFRPVAVVGLACRFPDADGPEQFWQNLSSGRDCIREVPADRWSNAAHYDANAGTPGKTNCKWGGFVTGIDGFDPLFFNLSGREAEAMDPQQRVFLEECWRALEDAGYVGARVPTRCGVFAGVSSSDYLQGVSPEKLDGQALLGNEMSILPARISYFLNLKGPSLAVNTACSSALVATHLACQSIQLGQCDMALAGGVFVCVTPDFYVMASQAGMLASDGRCKTFDESANGFVPGEGVGVVVLKSLEAAQRDGDHIYGVIIGSCTNQDGKTNGITAPSSLSQTEVELAAYEQAGINPRTIGMVEAHGTGTKLGDPIEVEALTRAFRRHTQDTQFCAIGSVKTNIGHTCAAAGVAGLIKALLSLKHGVIPPTLGFKQGNPNIDFEGSPFFVARAPVPWLQGATDSPRRAAVSSFGFSGTNAHVVLEEAPARRSPHAERDVHLVLLSARSDAALSCAVAALGEWLTWQGSGEALGDIAYTLHAGRRHFRARAAFVVRSRQELLTALGRWGGPGDVVRIPREVGAAISPGDAESEALMAQARRYLQGEDLAIDSVYPHGRIVSLPTYPFERQRYWSHAASSVPVTEPPLVLEVAVASTGHVVRARCGASASWMSEHRVGGKRIVAAAVVLEVVRAAVEAAEGKAIVAFENIEWRRPLEVDAGLGLQVALAPHLGGVRFEVTVEGGEAVGTVGIARFTPPGGSVAGDRFWEHVPESLGAAAAQRLAADVLYEQLRANGLEHGEGYRVLREIRRSDRWVVAELALAGAVAQQLAELRLHPALLDGALQAMVALEGGAAAPSLRVPYALDCLEVIGPLDNPCKLVVWRRNESEMDACLLDRAGEAAVVWRGLAVAAALQGSGATVAQLFEPRWVRTQELGPAELSPTAVVFYDRASGPDRRLEKYAETVIAVRPASRFERIAEREFELNPADPDDYAALLGVLDDRIERFTLLMGFGEGSGCLQDDAGLTRPFEALFHLLGALQRRGLRGTTRVWAIYRQDREHGACHAAALGGFARAAMLENPELRVKVIGVEADQLEPHWARIQREVLDDANAEVRFGADGARRVRDYAELGLDIGSAGEVRRSGVYVISGGSGALGRVFASHLSSQGAQVLLMGRSAQWLGAPSRRAVSASSVHYEQADVTDRGQVERALARARAELGPIRGVVHAAGTIRDALLIRQTIADARDILRPKLLGARWLDIATASDDLEFFALFSSLAAVLGNIGQTSYAYANSFLDEYAIHRASLSERGLRRGRTIAFGWPLWREGGMRPAAEDAIAHAEGLGLGPLETSDGLRLFEAALKTPAAHLIVASDGARLRRVLRQAGNEAPVSLPRSDRAALPRLEDVRAYLSRILAEVSRIDERRIRPEEPFESYGFDSVLMMQLTRRLEKDFGELPKTLFFEYQNLAQLADHFAARYWFRRPGVESDARGGGANRAAAGEQGSSPAEGQSLARTPTEAVAADDRVAIIGMAGRYPMAADVEQFWRNLVNGRDCIAEVPPERWKLDGFFDPVPGEPGRSYSKWGGFLEAIDEFDSTFFKVAPLEADMIDPQERLFLQTVWHAMEDAGASRADLSKGQTGVFVGVMYGEYQLFAPHPDGRVPVSSFSSIANRVSYFFNFRGPSLAVDTMCSSSLTAIHLACEAIRRGECNTAVAGGVNLCLHPRKYVQLSLARFVASDGRCRSFGDGGDGYVPGEGVGAVLLKPLAAALADGDRIWAVINGSMLNHGGKTNGYTVPNPLQQAAVITAALKRARTRAVDIDYVEAHGTGTALGDPVEVRALDTAYGEGRVRPCAIGSVKSNIGHLESAAGIAAVTKTVMQLRRGFLVPSLHSQKLNPHLELDRSRLVIQQTLEAWPRRIELGAEQPRRAGLSSFGAGGSNAHLVLEEAPAVARPAESAYPQVLVLSARTRRDLLEMARRLAQHLRGEPPRAPEEERMMVAIVELAARRAGLEPREIEAGDALGDCGLDEVACQQLVRELQTTFDIEADAGTSLSERTVRELATLLTRGVEGSVESPQRALADADRSSSSQWLADVAYTLQLGREEMSERLAVVATELADAATQLECFARGEPGTAVFTSMARADSIGQPAPQRALEPKLGGSRDLGELAKAWVGGDGVDWRALHAGRQRRKLSLPVYPFAGRRHWLSQLEVAPSPAAARPAAKSEASPARAERPMALPAVALPAVGLPAVAAAALHTGSEPGAAAAVARAAATPSPEDTRARLVAELVTMATSLVGLPVEEFEPRATLGDYGFESMALKELAERIASGFGVPFSPPMFFEHPSMDAIAGALMMDHPAKIAAHYAEQSQRSPGVPATKPVVHASGGRPIDDARNEPIAIVGMSARFPGSPNLQKFWENLQATRDLVTEIPAERWDWRAYDNDSLPPGERCKYHWGAFIDDADKFDSMCFGISPAEAEMMDPQQRLLLETVWAAIEDAGYRPSSLARKSVGVFTAVQFHDYLHLLHEAGILNAMSGLGNEHSIVANRISYLLNVHGPSEPVNTACSSSLVAVHRAVQSLRAGECESAIVGGVALNLTPASTMAAGMMGILSPDGKCRTLDRAANGYVKGEGVAAIVIKPLSSALAAGDHVYALIKGSATNHGGKAASLTAPNPEAQARLIEAAMRDARIHADQLGYIELHGTGTELGDPVEINGIKRALQRVGSRAVNGAAVASRCAIGSVKTNIGHLEPASGIAGMLKAVLAMRHQTLPGICHMNELNPYIDLTDTPLYVAEKTMPWQRSCLSDGTEEPLRAGVSSFGFGGVNAHVVLEEYLPNPVPAAVDGDADAEQVFVFSHRTAEGLKAGLEAFLAEVQRWERQASSPLLANVAYTLREGREEYSERAACIARTTGELRSGVECLLRGEQGERAKRGRALARGASLPGETRLEALAEHWVKGGQVAWQMQGASGARRERVSLPTYVFSRVRHWFQAPAAAPIMAAAATAAPPDEMALSSAPADVGAVKAALRRILHIKLKLTPEQLSDELNFQDLGIDSMIGAMIMQVIQETFGSQVPLSAVSDYPTIGALADYIFTECLDRGDVGDGLLGGKPAGAKRAALRLPPELIPINMQGRQRHSFWVHGATGYAAWFGNLSKALGPDYPLYAFQARGTDGMSMPQTFDEMVEHYLHCVRLVQGSGPYVLGGYSFGGLIALEMAHKLQQAGEEVRHLVMFDTYPPTQEVLDRHFGHYDEDFLEFYLINYFLRIHEHPERTIRREDIEHLPKRLRLLEMARLAKQRGGTPISVEDIYRYLKGGLLCSEQAEGMYQIYKTRPISDTDLLFFKATDGFTGKASAQYWRANNILEGYDYATPWKEIVRGPVKIQYLETDHLNMLEEPTLTIAANAIRPLLSLAKGAEAPFTERPPTHRQGLVRPSANGANGSAPTGKAPALVVGEGN